MKLCQQKEQFIHVKLKYVCQTARTDTKHIFQHTFSELHTTYFTLHTAQAPTVQH